MGSGIIWFILKGISRIPEGIVRLFSGILFFFLFYLARYRRRVVRDNLRRSYPDLPEDELAKIEKGYYRHLSELFPETACLIRIGAQESQERIRLANPDLLHKYLKAGKSLFILTGHTGNWEWGTLPFLAHGYRVFAVYKPQSSRSATELMNRIRQKPGVMMVPMKETYRAVKQELDSGRPPFIVGLIADQIPAKGDIHFWTRFLNQDTAFYTGGEKMARKFRMPVLYMEQRKTGFGRYETSMIELYDGIAEVPEYTITEQFVRHLEATINRDPRLWLWSHRRWKYGKEKVLLPDA